MFCSDKRLKVQIEGRSQQASVTVFCELDTCSAHYQPRATAGTYVISFVILLMWKEEAPLLSPDLVITTKKLLL